MHPLKHTELRTRSWVVRALLLAIRKILQQELAYDEELHEAHLTALFAVSSVLERLALAAQESEDDSA
jgi:hypothetical protein